MAIKSAPKVGPVAKAFPNKTHEDAPKVKADDFEAQDALKTLIKAEKIKQDPDLMDRVAQHADVHQKAIKSIKDIKKAYDRHVKFNKEDPYGETPQRNDAQAKSANYTDEDGYF